MKITASSTQTLLDLAVQTVGSVDKVFELIDLNPSIENVNSNPSGVEITYPLNNTFSQRFFINKGLTASSKPFEYYNTDGGGLLAENGDQLIQENGYKIIM